MGLNRNGWMLSDSDYHVLAMFDPPREVPPDRQDQVDTLVRLHLLRKAFIEHQEDEGVGQTAKLTEMGRQVLALEREARGEVETSFFSRLIARLAQ